VSQLFDAIAVRPQMARTLARHLEQLERGTLPARTRELCALMVAWLNACENCTQSHVDMARSLGVDQATLDELGDYQRSERFSAAERAALSAAVALTREPRALPPAVAGALREHYDPGTFVEIVATIGVHNYLTRLSNALKPV
jgi:AhpD family alkylhydroperoxidase